uniref:Cytochrome b-c1 complex subunit 8 n=1 Tax=Strigamia maritima TaxID=126957 RepID=T1JAA1_STRMM
MGLKFGELIKMRGIISFKLSPHEQNVLAGVFSQGIPNFLRRVKGQIFYIGPPFLFTYTLMSWATKDHDRRQRKDPSKYENEK